MEVELADEDVQRQVTYQYDSAGLRRTRTVGSDTTRYLWSGETLVEEQPQGRGAVLYERAAGRVLAAGGERILQDGLGSAVGRLSGSGTLTQLRYDAWGESPDGSRPTSTQPAVGYTGHAWDAEAGLTYAQQRWLDTRTGRFLSEDPMGAEAYLGTPQGLNPWLYANGNPTRYTDPDGRMSWGPAPGMAVGLRAWWESDARQSARRGADKADALSERFSVAVGDHYNGPNVVENALATGTYAWTRGLTGAIPGVVRTLVAPEDVFLGIYETPERIADNCGGSWSGTAGVERGSACVGEVSGLALSVLTPVRAFLRSGPGGPKPQRSWFGKPPRSVPDAADVDDLVARGAAAGDLELESTYQAMTTPLEIPDHINGRRPRVDITSRFDVIPIRDGRFSLAYGNPELWHGIRSGVDEDGIAFFNVRADKELVPERGSGKDMLMGSILRFRQGGVEVRKLRGTWVKDSDSVNYREFQANLDANMEPEVAAANTWSGRLYRDLGYPRVESVQDVPNVGIVVVFGR